MSEPVFSSGTFRTSLGASLGRAIDAVVNRVALRVVLRLADVDDAVLLATAELSRRLPPDAAIERQPGHVRLRFETPQAAGTDTHAIVLWSDGDRGWCDYRLVGAQPQSAAEPSRRAPPFLAALAAAPGFDEPQPGADLTAFLRDPRRALPVVAVSEPAAVDVARVRERCGPLAHVVAVSQETSWRLTDAFGKRGSVYLGAVRLYAPRDDPGAEPNRSVLYLAETIRSIEARARDDGGTQRGGFADLLVRTVFARITADFEDRPFGRPEAPRARPPVGVSMVAMPTAPPDETPGLRARIVELEGKVVEAHAAAARANATAEDFYAQYFEVVAERDRLRDQLDALARGELDLSGLTSEGAGLVRDALALVTATRQLAEREANARADLAAITAEREALRGEVGRLRLRAALADEPPAPAPEARERPGYDDPDGFAAYIATRYGDALLLHPRARRSFADGEFGDLNRLYDALDLLAVEGRAQRRGAPGARDAYLARLDALRLRDGPAITETGRGQFRELYTLEWDGRQREIDEHLRSKATGFEPRRTLAIYYFWDAEREANVVCSLPGHLDNTRS